MARLALPPQAGLAQAVCEELEERASAWAADLDRLRRRAVDLACCELGGVVEAAALEVIRAQVAMACCFVGLWCQRASCCVVEVAALEVACAGGRPGVERRLPQPSWASCSPALACGVRPPLPSAPSS